MTNVLDTTDDGRYRVRLFTDNDAPNPRHDRDTQVHVITIDTHLGQYIPVDRDGGPLAEAWHRVCWNRWTGVDIFTRYVSIFHDGIVLESAPEKGARSLWYMTGEEMIALDAGLLSEGYIEAEMEEYEAWAEGDTWAWVIEERVDWTRDGDESASMETWEEVDSCSGYYGATWARKEAREALRHFVSSRSKEDQAS
ncbi:hypothetical protein G6W61_10410 [Streptomyces sp. KAI-26]|uniref:hypothetical protein n=1 Tax=Streptomyces sp. KAI-26 TaxID=1169747 RepID=UPI001587912F|nr:hypothetical protein [Streptomyces sp. KAI-26]NUV86618.1 hypothetical protein [Streptomyces sp. KAI-26]NUW21187.1 hypothetical protein [Streptomyces roseoviolaceus]